MTLVGRESSKLLRANSLILFGLSSSISTVNAIPLNVEFTELFFSNQGSFSNHSQSLYRGTIKPAWSNDSNPGRPIVRFASKSDEVAKPS